MFNITVFVNLNLKGGPSKNATELSSLAVTTLNGRFGLKIAQKQFINQTIITQLLRYRMLYFVLNQTINILCQNVNATLSRSS